MLTQLRASLTYANVMATMAVFVALGGTSYAVATGSIDSRELKDNNVRSKDLRNNDVRGTDVRKDTLTGSDINESRLGTVPNAGSAANATNAANADSANRANTAASAAKLDGKTGADVGRWAQVGSNGGLGAGFGLTSSRLPGTNTFVVTASEPIANCAAIASPGAFTGQTSVFPGSAGSTPDPNSVTILTQDSAGNSIAAGFTVAVLC